MSLSMLNRSIASMAGRSMAGSYDVQEYFWGAKVTKKEPSFKWNPQVKGVAMGCVAMFMISMVPNDSSHVPPPT